MSSSQHSLDFLLERISFREVEEMLKNKNFWAEYEPVIELKNGEIFGYEALARFVYRGRSLPPAPILELVHHSKAFFFRLEKELKLMQIKHRPPEGVLFVNIDPHNFDTDEKIDFWDDLFSKEEQICIEVTENSDNLQASLLSSCLSKLKNTGAFIAQDDIGNNQKPFCFELTVDAHVLKFDRSWFHKIKVCSHYAEILKGFITFAKYQNKKTIMEGVETEEELAFAKKIGVDFVQGYLFKYLNLSSK